MHRLFTLPRLWLSLLILAIAFLIYCSSLPGNDQPLLFKHADKVMHFGYFMGISGLLNLYWTSQHPSSYLRLAWLSIIMVAIIGALDEWYQSFTPGRFGNDMGDWIADCTGGILGYLIVYSIYQRYSPYLATKNNL